MYSVLLSLHSLVRWLVLAGMAIALYRAYRGWLSQRVFTSFDNAVRHWTATTAHIQLLLGAWLYFVSPIVDFFYDNFAEAVHQRDVRFFGMEHSLMMLIAIVIITIGSAKAKRRNSDPDKFKTMAIWFTVAFIIVFLSIPWSFSPFTGRPLFRGF